MKHTRERLCTAAILMVLSPISIAASAEQAGVSDKTSLPELEPTFEHAEPEHEFRAGDTKLKLSRFKNWRNGTLAWLAAETSFSREIKCNGSRIGQIDFLFRPYSWITTTQDFAGVAIEGGFVAETLNSPCGSVGYKPNTNFRWVQMVYCIAPLNGNASNTYYMDVKSGVNPKVAPWYPSRSNDGKNPNGTSWDKQSSYYDAPRRPEKTTQVTWSAMNMLVCENGAKINVLAHFLYGYVIQPGTLNDGSINASGFEPHTFTTDPHPGIIKILSEHLKGDKTKKGFAVSTGCCCPKPRAADATSAADGQTSVTVIVPDGESLDAIAIFPRNRDIDWSQMGPGPDGFYAESSEWFGVPLLPWQDEPTEHLLHGAYLYPEEGTIMGPAEFTFDVPLMGHESFLDLYFLDSGWEWNPWVQVTDHLLGDMNTDTAFTVEDLELLNLALTDPDEYQQLYPDVNMVFVGDLDHDNAIGETDLALLADLVYDVYEESDLYELDGCPTDLDGDGQVDVIDLLGVLGDWGDCNGCPADTNDDGQIDVYDLLDILGDWGSCSDG